MRTCSVIIEFQTNGKISYVANFMVNVATSNYQHTKDFGIKGRKGKTKKGASE